MTLSLIGDIITKNIHRYMLDIFGNYFAVRKITSKTERPKGELTLKEAKIKLCTFATTTARERKHIGRI